MARIYLNCGPCTQTNGSSIYSVSRLIILVIFILIGLLLLIPLPRVFSLSSKNVNPYSTDIQYAIVIDCGSSGSRVYVYYWPPHSGNPNDLLDIQQLHDDSGNPVVKKVSPGLSSFGENPSAASDHIKELLLFAQEYIPRQKWPETILHVMATAGMRMLPESQQKSILLDLRRDIKMEFNFIAPDEHYEVISGKQEGVYAWIAINFALGRFTHVEDRSDKTVPTIAVPHILPGQNKGAHYRKKTVGMIDMGGGSMQIAFEVPNTLQVKQIPSTSLLEFNLGCQETDAEHTYSVYVSTFLGFGANSARDRYEETLIKEAAKAGTTTTSDSQPISDACLPNGLTIESDIDDKGPTFFRGTGEFQKCKTALEPLTNKTIACKKDPCSMNGVHQPVIDPTMEFYGFSEFWYSMEDVFNIGGHYDQEKFLRTAEAFCGTPWDTLKAQYEQKQYPKADDDRFKYQCFKGAWMMDVLHQGFSFPPDYNNFESAQLVNGKDVGWTLGAIIYKTRFLPLRHVEYENIHSQAVSQSAWQRFLHFSDLHFLLVLCLLVVIAAIVVYMKWLRCCPKKSDLARVPSMSYFMTDVDQMEKGTAYSSKGQGYTL